MPERNELPSQWVPVPFPTHSLPLRSEYLFNLQQSVAQTRYPICDAPLSRSARQSFAPIQKSLRSLFLLRKGPLPFLMVDATIGNQVFSHVRCYIFPELSYNKANNTFFYSLKENNVEAQVEFTLKVTERARVTRC